MPSMKREKILILVVVLLILLNLVSLGMHWRMRRVKENAKPKREQSDNTRQSRFLFKELGLSDEQKSRVAGIQRKHIVGIRELERAHLKLRREYLNLALSPEYNSARGDSLINEMAQLNAQMQKNTWLLFRNIYVLCTPDQQRKYRQLMLEVERRRDKRENMPVPFRKEDH